MTPLGTGQTQAAIRSLSTAAPGERKILIQLVNANHQPIDQGTVRFTMPAAKGRPEAH
jgi:hypothetical protein